MAAKYPPVAGFAFADPSASPLDFNALSPQDILADTKAPPSDTLQPVPVPWSDPPVLELAQVLGQAAVSQIAASNQMVFHCFGDSGGVKAPAGQFAVAEAISADLAGKDLGSGQPAFLYHLGDVVYFFGQERYYYDQFYDPYHNYDAPIFAIPGNHDGAMFPKEAAVYSLEGFCNNFCTKTPAKTPIAQGFARTTMIQPGVYFTLNTPFIKIIGLYSNTSEGATQGVISGKVAGPAQVAFLTAQLKIAAAERAAGTFRALAIAIHHPPFTGSADHAPSPDMLKDIDAACAQTGIQPDIVLSGHAHLYERYTRAMGTGQIPYLVAGTGGYYNLSGMKVNKSGQKLQRGAVGTDAVGNKLTLEQFNDTSFGYLRLTVDSKSILGEFVAVPTSSAPPSVFDSFKLDLNAHTVTTVPV